MPDAKPISFMTACSKYFGKKDGQSLAELGAELKNLAEEDRAELRPLLEAELGVPVLP